MASFGDYQIEIYFAGLSGVVPTLPMTFDELVNASFDRPLTSEERAELNRRIVEEPGGAERFAYLARLHADLHALKDIRPVRSTRRRRGLTPTGSPIPAWGWVAAASILAALIIYVTLPGQTSPRPTAVTPKPDPAPPRQRGRPPSFTTWCPCRKCSAKSSGWVRRAGR